MKLFTQTLSVILCYCHELFLWGEGKKESHWSLSASICGRRAVLIQFTVDVTHKDACMTSANPCHVTGIWCVQWCTNKTLCHRLIQTPSPHQLAHSVVGWLRWKHGRRGGVGGGCMWVGHYPSHSVTPCPTATFSCPAVQTTKNINWLLSTHSHSCSTDSAYPLLQHSLPFFPKVIAVNSLWGCFFLYSCISKLNDLYQSCRS